MTDLHARRRDIALAEQEVERQRGDLQRRTTETRARVAHVRARWSSWKAPLIIGGGAVLGLLLGRRVLASERPHRQETREHRAVDGPIVAQTAKAAGKMAGLMAGLSLASRALPIVLPLLSAYAERRGRTDWWRLARGIAPLMRR